MTKIEHFCIVRAEVDDQARIVTLTLSREPTGEISTKKAKQWAVNTLTRQYSGYMIQDKCNNETV
jgi:hypothetical protein